jgi:hypothetical protein
MAKKQKQEKAPKDSTKSTAKKPGRKKVWTEEKKEDLLVLFREFIDDREFPVIQTFCAEHHIWQQRLDEWPEFAETIKICKNKATAYLIENGIKARGGLKPAVVIFTLKNIAGWRDKVDVEHSGAIGRPLDLSKLTDEELAAAKAIAEKAGEHAGD